jgi:hypothetical protein
LAYGGKAQGERIKEFLFSEQISTYYFVLTYPGTSVDLKETMQRHLNRFAFEGWLEERRDPSACSLKWHSYIRDLLHRQAEHEGAFRDPLKLFPYFDKDGELIQSAPWYPPVTGGITNLTYHSYKTLADEFGLAYFDFAKVFPPKLPPGGVFTEVSPQVSADLWEYLTNRLAGKEWRMLRVDTLKVDLENPVTSFDCMPLRAKTYFFPAYLLMCEREEGPVQDLPVHLLEALVGEAPENVRLRASFTIEQRKYIVAFFEEVLRSDTKPKAALQKLRNEWDRRSESHP